MADNKRVHEQVVVQENSLMHKMLDSGHRQGHGDPDTYNNQILIGIDPGETTGFAWRMPWDGNKIHLEQLVTKDPVSGAKVVKAALPNLRLPSSMANIAVQVVCEDYKIYGWKADDHKWAGLHTPQLIGAIRYMLDSLGIPIVFQMAQEAKSWSTDEKLKMWGIYEAGMRHARDAQRHIVRYMFFGCPVKSEQTDR